MVFPVTAVTYIDLLCDSTERSIPLVSFPNSLPEIIPALVIFICIRQGRRLGGVGYVLLPSLILPDWAREREASLGERSNVALRAISPDNRAGVTASGVRTRDALFLPFCSEVNQVAVEKKRSCVV